MSYRPATEASENVGSATAVRSDCCVRATCHRATALPGTEWSSVSPGVLRPAVRSRGAKPSRVPFPGGAVGTRARASAGGTPHRRVAGMLFEQTCRAWEVSTDKEVTRDVKSGSSRRGMCAQCVQVDSLPFRTLRRADFTIRPSDPDAGNHGVVRSLRREVQFPQGHHVTPRAFRRFQCTHKS